MSPYPIYYERKKLLSDLTDPVAWEDEGIGQLSVSPKTP